MDVRFLEIYKWHATACVCMHVDLFDLSTGTATHPSSEGLVVSLNVKYSYSCSPILRTAALGVCNIPDPAPAARMPTYQRVLAPTLTAVPW
jgi:hypothetical protein